MESQAKINDVQNKTYQTYQIDSQTLLIKNNDDFGKHLEMIDIKE